MRAHRKEVVRTAAYDVHIVGVPRPGLRDFYHFMLRMPWWAAFLTIVGGYLLLNGIFASLYFSVGGVANVRPGSWLDAFFFSVQTMGTIGYGAMYPTSTGANILVVSESVTGLVVTALATGLVFVRFSQVRPRVVFSSKVTIGPMDGVPTLMARVGNERRGSIVNCQFRLSITRTMRTAEGVTMYRTVDIKLERDRAAALSRAWQVMHRVVEGSPLYGETAESVAAADTEILMELVGTDDTSLQAVHAQHRWFAGSIVWGSRLADIVTETPDGNMLVDLRRFHDVVPV
jgi:inward rectifier potassium channel